MKHLVGLFCVAFLFLCSFAGLLIAAEPLDSASLTVAIPVAPEPLRKFGRQIVAGNRSLISSGHELESAMFEKIRALADFSPQFSFSTDSSKAANRSFNPLTGIEEDYSTRRQGSNTGISQKTPLGRVSYDYSQSTTEYTSSTNSYFRSLYLGWQAGILRNDARLNSLTRRQAHVGYEISRAQADSVLLDVLQASFQSLFNRMVAARNQQLKEQNLSFYATLVEEAEIKLKNGMGSELDLKQASMRYQQADTGKEETALSLRETDRKIGLQMGSSHWNSETASFSLDPVLAAIPRQLLLSQLIDLAFLHRPDYRIFAGQYKLQQTAFERTRTMSRPDLSVRARWGKQGRGFEKSAAAQMQDKSWDVALVYAFSFGPDGEKLSFSSQRQKLKAFEAKFAQKKDEVKASVTEAFERLEFYRRNLDALKASEKLSAEVLEGQRLNFQLGKISLLDLTRYQQDFDNASLAVVQGEARLVMEWLSLLYETGSLADYFNLSAGRDRCETEIIPVDGLAGKTDE